MGTITINKEKQFKVGDLREGTAFVHVDAYEELLVYFFRGESKDGRVSCTAHQRKDHKRYSHNDRNYLRNKKVFKINID